MSTISLMQLSCGILVSRVLMERNGDFIREEKQKVV